MAKMYTLDGKLLCGSPEIRINDKVFPVDDRKNTVKKAMKLFNSSKDNSDEMDMLDEVLKLAFGKNFPEIDELDLSFAAYQELAEMTIAAMTGEDYEDYKKRKAEKAQSFPEQ